MLYVVALGEPLDAVIGEVDRLQVGAASTSRLLGIAEVPPDREPGDRLPDGVELTAEDLRFAYREGHDVLHGVDLRLGVGERLAIVGPERVGQVDARAGCSRASTAPAPARRGSAASTWSTSRWRCCAPRSRW